MIINKSGGGYLVAIFNVVQRNPDSGRIESVAETIFGMDEFELWQRIRIRFPKYRQNNRNRGFKQPWRRTPERR